MTQPEFSFSRDDRTNRSRVLALLRDGKPHSTLELQAVGGTRAPARVAELRERGFDIACTGERGVFVYRLVQSRVVAPKLTRRQVERLAAAWRGVA